MTYKLDFSLLPGDTAFEARPLLIGLPDAVRSRFSSAPQTLERIECALMFAGQAPKQSEPWRAAGFLRAALAEYCSIEEMQAVDMPSSKHFKLASSPHPLIHLLELVRHLNIHVRTTQTRSHSIEFTAKGQPFDMNVYVITDLRAADLASLRNGAKYDRADLDQTVQWFLARQVHWGAGDLITMGVNRFAEELCSHYRW
jgi:hypothetical protein